MKIRSLALVATCVLVGVPPVLTADWPQFRGPDRSGWAADKGLLQEWPKAGPPLLWTYNDAGLGYSSPAIVGDRLYTMGARGDSTFVICLDVKTGKEVWHSKVGPIFTFKGNNWGDGPRSTPTVDGKLVYALGGYGDLVCLETETGNEVWRKSLPKDLGGEMMTSWGYCESPLVDDEHLVCTPGGPQGTLAALDKKTGKVVWRSQALKDKATYSSLCLLKVGGVRQYVTQTFGAEGEAPEPGASATGVPAVVGVASGDGKLLWRQPFPSGSYYELTPTPVVHGDLAYVTGEAVGCQLLMVTPGAKDKFAVKEQYKATKTRKLMESWHGGVVLVGKHIYGHSHGRGWICQDLKSGKAAWQERSKLPGSSGTLIYGDGRLYLLSDEGVAVLLRPSPDGWHETGRFELPQKSKLREGRPTSSQAGIWTHPAIANGRLYLRDQELLFCYDIRAPK
jgi:outer membrane protein assembly factor BamB